MPTRDIKEYLKSGEVDDVKIGGTAAEQSALPGDGTKEAKVLQFTPQAIEPAHSEGQEYYDDALGVKVIQGKYPTAPIRVGRGMQMEVQNTTGVDIPKGTAVRQVGVLSGRVQITPALADTFDHARLIGITQHEIKDEEIGVLATFGEITGLNTSLLPIGQPLYLSDTIPGAFSSDVPDIATRIGGALVSHSSEGRLFVYIINNKSLPGVFGGLKGQTAGNETYNVTTVAQDIINYATERAVLMPVTPLTGLIEIGFDGDYRANFVASYTFPSTATTRSITFELYDTVEGVHFSYTKNIPRDATSDGASFSFPFEELTGSVHKMRIRSSVAIDVTFTEIVFDVESVLIK